MISYSSFFDELEKISGIQVGRLARIAQRTSELVGNPTAVNSAIASAAGVAGLTGGIAIGRKRRRKKNKTREAGLV